MKLKINSVEELYQRNISSYKLSGTKKRFLYVQLRGFFSELIPVALSFPSSLFMLTNFLLTHDLVHQRNK